MMTPSEETEREVNEYLYYEFGLGDETNEGMISESWPFVLEYVGGFERTGERTDVYRFRDGEDVFYATVGVSLDFVPAAGMELNDLRLEALGRRWIADRNPIDLDTSRLGDPAVPPAHLRRAAIEQLIRDRLSDPDTPEILEGLFLQRTRDYLVLVPDPASVDHALLIGAGAPVERVEFPDASENRRLSIAVGRLVEAGQLPQ